jgi:hypothetical protein
VAPELNQIYNPAESSPIRWPNTGHDQLECLPDLAEEDLPDSPADDSMIDDAQPSLKPPFLYNSVKSNISTADQVQQQLTVSDPDKDDSFDSLCQDQDMAYNQGPDFSAAPDFDISSYNDTTQNYEADAALASKQEEPWEASGSHQASDDGKWSPDVVFPSGEVKLGDEDINKLIENLEANGKLAKLVEMRGYLKVHESSDGDQDIKLRSKRILCPEQKCLKTFRRPCELT